MKEIKVLLVGAGALGRRHLQSLGQLGSVAHISVVEPSTAALQLAEKVFYDAANKCVKASFYECFDDLALPLVYDVCVVATGAGVRYQILEKLLNTCIISSFVLEKILFQNTSDLVKAAKLLDKKEVDCWVNCPRRMFEGYCALKKLLEKEECVHIEVIGSGWGMACNAIHFIDMLGYLVSVGEIFVDLEGLESNVVKSKRDGYLEVIGVIKAFDQNGSRLVMSCSSEDIEPIKIKIQYSRGYVIIDESQGTFNVFNGGRLVGSGNVGGQYQSQLTSKVVESIVELGTCDLTPFRESYKYHYSFLQEMLKFFKRNYDFSLTVSPIT